MVEPSGEKYGLSSVPGELVNRVASPPDRETIQRSPAKLNTIDVRLMVGCCISNGFGPGSNADCRAPRRSSVESTGIVDICTLIAGQLVPILG